jgi:glycosyltransferase involved in cell wall biosynthesis
MAKYSVCMTCYNEFPNVRESLGRLLVQLNEDYEVVVVDNFSRDGTYEVLGEFERSHGVRVIQRRCTRGVGRQIAFENSCGDYIIANLDLDDMFTPVLGAVVAGYHRKVEGKLMAAFNSPPTPGGRAGWSQNITIGPRALIASIGGWRDLNIYEDWDIWSRAARTDSYRWTSFRFAENEPLPTEPKGAYTRLSRRIERYRNRVRLGLKVFTPGEKVGLSQRVAYIVARLTSPFHPALSGQDPRFNSFDPRFYVELGAFGSSAGPN